MGNGYTCCITGHRYYDSAKEEYIIKRLKLEIVSALKKGFVNFISGAAYGIDLMFAQVLSSYINQNAFCKQIIKLELALPDSSWINRKAVLSLLSGEAVSIITIVSQKNNMDRFMERNKYMVNKSQLIIGVYDVRQKGGTVNTLNYAKSLNRETIIIKI